MLEVWDANGVKILDGNTYMFKRFGAIDIGQPGSGNGGIADGRFAICGNGLNFARWLLLAKENSPAIFSRPNIYLDGITLRWDWRSSERMMFTLVYGVV